MGRVLGFVWSGIFLPSNIRQIIMQGPDHENLKFLYSHVMKRSYILVAKEHCVSLILLIDAVLCVPSPFLIILTIIKEA